VPEGGERGTEGDAVSRTDRKFARFYYDDFIREFPEVYADDAAFAAWMRLLVRAEKDWPTVPELPRSVRPRAVRALVDAGLVMPCDAHCYRIRGLDAERSRRQGLARNAAGVRWQSESNADGNASAHASAMPRRDETRRDEIPPPPTSGGRRKDRTNARANGVAPRQTGDAPRQNGESPRQEREREKRGGMPTSVNEILRRAAAEGHQ
jgi:hypothetical protein